ncbi:MAG: MFS transporter [bacterium]|nr:MFS transporter [bacterium]
MQQTTERQGFGAFSLIWGGQMVSVVGTGMTGFAVGVWIYQTTGSVTQFTLAVVSAALPGLLLMPFLGVWIDQWGRRKAMLVGDTGAALRTVALLALWTSGNLEVWHIYVAAVVRSIFEGLQMPAYLATVTVLVPERHHARANGMIQFGSAAAGVVSPAAAGLLFSRSGLGAVLVLDLLTFAIGIVTLLSVRIPHPVAEAGGENGSDRKPRGRWHQASFGWRYIRRHPGLLALAVYFGILNLFIGFAFVLVTPLVLSFDTAAGLGWVLSLGSGGALAGSVLISLWGGPKRRLLGILMFSPWLGLGMVIIGLQASLVVVAVGVTVFFFGLPIINALNHAIWQTRVAPEIQGRVFTTRTLIGQITAPVAYLLAGPLADGVFEPSLATGGPLVELLGSWLGVGEGRGIGLQFLVMGLLLILAGAVASTYRPLRQVEREATRQEQED